jgi:hypothetical protein
MKVAVCGGCDGTDELLQRRVGGVLGNLATVVKARRQDLARLRPELVVTWRGSEHHHGTAEVCRALQLVVEGVELDFLPCGLKQLAAQPRFSRVCVAASHLTCANRLLAALLKAGMLEWAYSTATFEKLHEVEGDLVVTAEDLAGGGRFPAGVRVITLPRSISSESAMHLVSLASKIAPVGGTRVRNLGA